MENKIIKDVMKIINKLEPKDAETLMIYATGSECCIKNLADQVLNLMESGDILTKSQKQLYKNIEKDYNIAKANFEYLSDNYKAKNKK